VVLEARVVLRSPPGIDDLQQFLAGRGINGVDAVLVTVCGGLVWPGLLPVQLLGFDLSGLGWSRRAAVRAALMQLCAREVGWAS